MSDMVVCLGVDVVCRGRGERLEYPRLWWG